MDIMKMGESPNYLGSWDIDEADGRRLTLTISKIVDEEVVSAGRKEICTCCYWQEGYKPMILNITNKKRIAKLYKTKQTENLIGKRLMITTEKVNAFGGIHDALRVVQQIPAVTVKKVLCEVCGAEIEAVGKMNGEQVAAYTKKKYGKMLCGKCAAALAEKDAEGAKENEPKAETDGE